MIAYTNSLQDFLSQYISINNIAIPLNTYEESLQSDVVYINPETLGESFKTVGEAITQYKSDKGSNPTEPAAIIGTENQTFIKTKIAECSNLYEKIRSLNNSLKPFTQGDVIEKSNLPKVKTIVKEMFETLDKIYDVQEELYDRIDEIGMQAESITLSNHPMKNEILDMKNVTNKSKKVFKLLAQNTPNDAKEKIQEIKSLKTQVLLISNKYSENYTAIRGGQEMGRQWYENSKVLTKKHTFNDYVDCAELLVKEKYTSADRLFANGLSAGGMLMGVVINMRPDLFRGVIAEVPWMDVITDMYNDDLPLTTLEYSEWGDPHIREQYDYMLSWSPYDNLKPTKFPAILATGGLNDTQVTYYNPAKWVAKVKELNQGDNPVLFKCNMDAGHGGASGRFDRFHLRAMKYAWVLSLQESK